MNGRPGPCARGWAMCFAAVSGAEEDLDGLPGIHRLVAGRCLFQRQLEVEHLAGVDPPIPDQVDELGQEPADRGGAAVRLIPEKNSSSTGSATSWKTPTYPT
jgi:hypothetical protein